MFFFSPQGDGYITFVTECLALRGRDPVQSRASGRLDFGLTALAADEDLFGRAEMRGCRVHFGLAGWLAGW